MRWSNLDLNLATPPAPPSPDEMVIQARGRRQVPLTFSPDISRRAPALRQQRGGAKPTGSPTRGPSSSRLLPRTSPRKRLTATFLSDTSHPGTTSSAVAQEVYPPVTPSQSPDLKLKISPLTKKPKLDNKLRKDEEPGTAVKGLSHAQLVDLFNRMMIEHP